MAHDNLRAEISRKRLKQSEIAAILKINDKTLRNKISGKTDFSYPEAVMLRDTFFPDLSLKYLFEPTQELAKDTG